MVKLKMDKNRDNKGRFVKGSKGHLGHKHSDKTKKIISNKKIGTPSWNKGISYKPGKEHWNWRGGISKRTCKEINYIKWRMSIFERDNYTCQECGKHGVKLNAHHIRSWSLFPELRYEISNGITYCEFCHLKTGKHLNIKKGGKKIGLFNIRKNKSSISFR